MILIHIIQLKVQKLLLALEKEGHPLQLEANQARNLEEIIFLRKVLLVVVEVEVPEKEEVIAAVARKIDTIKVGQEVL